MAGTDKGSFLNKLKKYKLLGFIAIDWLFIYIIYKIKEWIYNNFPTFERQFSIEDPTISHPKKNDTLKWEPLLHYTLTACFIVIIFVQIVKRDWKYSLNQALLGLMLGYLVTNTLTDFVKSIAGRYRPDFLDICNVDFAKVDEQYNYYQNLTNSRSVERFGPRNLFNTTICSNPDRSSIESEQKSFPSGHASFAFVTMTYLALYLAGQLRLFDGKARVWKYFIVCIPMFLATLVPLSRLMDYRHHWQDVLAGSLMGIFIGIVTYFFFYPSLRSPLCDKPYRPLDKSKKNDDEVEDDVIQENEDTQDNNKKEGEVKHKDVSEAKPEELV